MNKRALCLKCYMDLPKYVFRQIIRQLNFRVNAKNYKLYHPNTNKLRKTKLKRL